MTGWYGAPGITVGDATVACGCPEKPTAACPGHGIPYEGVDNYNAPQCVQTCFGTTVFLVGKHFSVHDTNVIAGGRCVPFQLISREIMQVTIPPNATRLKNVTVEESEVQEVIDVHVATPYGVSNHLLIPALAASAPQPEVADSTPKEGFSWTTASYKAGVSPIVGTSKAPYFHFQYLGSSPTAPSIKNAFKHPTPPSGVFVAIVQADNKSKPYGQTPEFPVARKRNNLVIGQYDAQQLSLADEIKSMVEQQLRYEEVPTTITVTGFLTLDGWPPVQLDSPMVIKLTELPGLPYQAEQATVTGVPSPVPSSTGILFGPPPAKSAE